ncbi:MAG: ABC transporter permease subunit [Acidimicrobiia bacterium]
MVDLEETPQTETEPSRPDTPGPELRRTLKFIIFLVIGIVVYAYGFQVTDVNLDEIKSETRQNQLVLVLRALARPDLLTYERDETPTDVTFYMPCPAGGFTPEAPALDTRALTLSPSCVEPGGEITVTGAHFAANARGTLYQVPPSGDLELRLASFQTDANGNFSLTVDTRERANDEPQTIRAVTSENVGTIFNRVEVWQDDNGNGVQDPVRIPDGGTFTTDLGVSPPAGAGVALLDPGRNVVDFVTLGDPFVATNGPARDDLAVPIDEPRAATVRITGLTDQGQLTLEGPGGTDLSQWQAVLYNPDTGTSSTSAAVTDSILKSPRLSRSAIDTWNRIIETVFLAFLATTLGTLIAVPMSFLAARNLMRDIRVPMTKLALQVLALPVGVGVGVIAAGWAGSISERITGSTVLSIVGLIVIPAIVWRVVRWAVPPIEDEIPSPGLRIARAFVLAVSALAAIVVLFLLASLMSSAGDWLAPRLASLGFLGSFVGSLGDILAAIITLITALATAGVLVVLAGTLGGWMKSRLPAGVIKVIRLPLAAAAGGLLAVVIGIGVGRLYQITDPLKVYIIPGAVGAAIGLALAIRAYRKEQIAVGLSIYYIARTVFNAIRSIEPLIMVIVFVVWVGLGPFAGSLALALHTVAALAKLYSEQVESILPGPIEAVRASGATRLQTIVYAVIPQIVPPYISFTLYRWDINVRMSTIIGFAGGGGIGFLLQQNIRLLNYRAASVNMLAIAIVVASMDYLSSRIRERIV